MMISRFVLGLIGVISATASAELYINGIDVTGMTNQKLDQVSIQIDGAGNIFIQAPQYHVEEQVTYHPVSGADPRPEHPMHLPPVEMSPLLELDDDPVEMASSGEDEESSASLEKPKEMKQPPEKPAGNMPQLIQKQGDKAL